MYIFLEIDVDEQFTEVKSKANIIDKDIGFKNSYFTLPLHISLKVSFKIDFCIKKLKFYLKILYYTVNKNKLKLFYY